MKGRPVDQLVYEYMFPKPKPSDPQNFHALLQRHLILEVRQEVHSFYGHLETQEAKYPGLDYTHPTHRIRLSRWQWHRRLFRAFDGLRLTSSEIAHLTKWEGTKWAKERFEKDQGITIHDTTADGFPDWVEPEDRVQSNPRAESQETEEYGEMADDNMGEDSDEELESIGVALNERLRERVALRNNSGDLSMPLDEEWEQWLKNAIESGEWPHMTEQIARMSALINPLSADELFPPRMMEAARSGLWHEVPDFLHDMIRQSLVAEQERNRQGQSQLSALLGRNGRNATSSLSPASSQRTRSTLALPNDNTAQEQRRTYSDLRLPASSSGIRPRVEVRVQSRAAQPGGS